MRRGVCCDAAKIATAGESTVCGKLKFNFGVFSFFDFGQNLKKIADRGIIIHNGGQKLKS